MKEEFKPIIESIIERIPHGMIFDTHTIIEYLLQNDSDVYLKNYNGKTTELYHADIGKTVSEIAANGLIKRIGDSWSLNIHKGFSECSCWKKE
jgi:hypothetical protein